MVEPKYIILRKIFFWLFLSLFLFLAPLLVYYSLGYRLDLATKKFIKTGVIFIESQPQGAEVFLNGNNLGKITPCILRNILPGKYNLFIKKKGFYPYQLGLKVEPNIVKKINAVLIPTQKDIEKIPFDFDVYKFLHLESFFNTKFITFTNKGIYLIDKDFNKFHLLTKNILNRDIVDTLQKVIFNSHLFLFWNQNNIWEIKEGKLINIYKAEKVIKNVLWGPRKRYILIQDGFKVIALDIKEPEVKIEILTLKSINAQIYFSSEKEMIYVRDKVGKDKFSMFIVKLKYLLKNEKNMKR